MNKIPDYVWVWDSAYATNEGPNKWVGPRRYHNFRSGFQFEVDWKTPSSCTFYYCPLQILFLVSKENGG